MVEETSFMKLKKALLELKDGYPDYVFYGKIEFFVKTGKKAVDLLNNHGIIDKIPREEVEEYIQNMPYEERQKLLLLPEEDRFRWYRLAPRGIDLVISMINLDYSEKIMKFNKAVIILTLVLVGMASVQLSLLFIQILKGIIF